MPHSRQILTFSVSKICREFVVMFKSVTWSVCNFEYTFFCRILFPSFSGFGIVYMTVHSFRCHVRNATIPCRSQELLPFLSVMYFSLPRFSTNYSSILSHLICHLFLCLPLKLVVTKFIYNTLLRILFSSILCACPNQCNLFKLIVSIIVWFFNTCINFFIG